MRKGSCEGLDGGVGRHGLDCLIPGLDCLKSGLDCLICAIFSGRGLGTTSWPRSPTRRRWRTPSPNRCLFLILVCRTGVCFPTVFPQPLSLSLPYLPKRCLFLCRICRTGISFPSVFAELVPLSLPCLPNRCIFPIHVCRTGVALPSLFTELVSLSLPFLPIYQPRGAPILTWCLFSRAN